VVAAAHLTAIKRYAERLAAHAGTEHHVVSALGAWLVLALCAGVAGDAASRAELDDVLGIDGESAFAVACALLTQPHPLVGAAAGAWYRSALETPKVEKWRARLPSAVETGELPTQLELDRWCAEHTLGLIEHFPIDLSPDVTCILASALATKVSWDVPFEVVDASELGPGDWSSQLRLVLRTPGGDHRHRQFFVETDELGPVAVHLASARGGLLVGSVIAVDEAARPCEVFAVAQGIVIAEAREPGSAARLSLFELPLGDGPLWSISEEDVETEARNGREERLLTVLPAWSAETTLDLGDESLGFSAAARVLGGAFDRPDWRFEARQTAAARYSALGFEAAAVTGLLLAMSASVRRPGVRREATVRFAHPYAVVAVACEGVPGRPAGPTPSPWHGLPVFSAWVSSPSDADPLHADRRRGQTTS
jgi:hypothetical protein